jgi:hypothetical protein
VYDILGEGGGNNTILGVKVEKEGASQEQLLWWKGAWECKGAVGCRRKRAECKNCARTPNKHYTFY